QPTFIGDFLRVTAKYKTGFSKNLLDKVRYLPDKFAVAATETYTSHSSESFTERVSNSNRGQQLHSWYSSDKAVTHRINNQDEPGQDHKTNKRCAPNRKSVLLTLNQTSQHARRRVTNHYY